jgi:hypothetical protein
MGTTKYIEKNQLITHQQRSLLFMFWGSIEILLNETLSNEEILPIKKINDADRSKN